jgi:hypothetical protein
MPSPRLALYPEMESKRRGWQHHRPKPMIYSSQMMKPLLASGTAVSTTRFRKSEPPMLSPTLPQSRCRATPKRRIELAPARQVDPQARTTDPLTMQGTPSRGSRISACGLADCGNRLLACAVLRRRNLVGQRELMLKAVEDQHGRFFRKSDLPNCSSSYWGGPMACFSSEWLQPWWRPLAAFGWPTPCVPPRGASASVLPSDRM